jgi:hypothetical protein
MTYDANIGALHAFVIEADSLTPALEATAAD